MIVTAFRQRTVNGVQDEHADIGKRGTIVAFEDEEAHNRWLTHRIHREAMHAGRATFFSDYTITACKALRVRQHPHCRRTHYDRAPGRGRCRAALR